MYLYRNRQVHREFLITLYIDTHKINLVNRKAILMKCPCRKYWYKPV